MNTVKKQDRFIYNDWFSHNIHVFKEYLQKPTGKKPMNILEVGVFEGRGTVWFIEQFKNVKVYAVDVWDTKHSHPKYKDVFNTFKKHIEPYKNQVVILKGKSSDMIRSISPKIRFDFVYIDASLHSKNALEDAVQSFILLKPGGLMIFDDYTHNKEHDINCRRPGIDAFINIYANEIEVLRLAWAVVIKKRLVSLPRRPCYSEYYKEPKTTPDEFIGYS